MQREDTHTTITITVCRNKHPFQFHSQQRGRSSTMPNNNGECKPPPLNTIGLSILR